MRKLFAGLFLPVVVVVAGLAVLFYHPKTPLADGWNPTKPRNPQDEVTLLTNWKLSRAVATPAKCSAALALAQAKYSRPADKETDENCHIRQRVVLDRIGNTSIKSLDTTCEMALRLAMWTRHSIQPAAAQTFNTHVSRIHHFGSYSCRKIRGSSNRMSEHATANALDISGFVLANGTRVMLKKDWNGTAQKRTFLREVRKGACDWFWLVLSPEYNTAHHDHFHVDEGRWPGCK